VNNTIIIYTFLIFDLFTNIKKRKERFSQKKKRRKKTLPFSRIIFLVPNTSTPALVQYLIYLSKINSKIGNFPLSKYNITTV
jgi:hypothetical protein